MLTRKLRGGHRYYFSWLSAVIHKAFARPDGDVVDVPFQESSVFTVKIPTHLD
jgi:hypothetical protein